MERYTTTAQLPTEHPKSCKPTTRKWILWESSLGHSIVSGDNSACGEATFVKIPMNIVNE